ncbi:MAG TPA: xanthine dehydrogenase family protein molybdopterin-binding subunit [Candidatus Limnocylindria bacterium]|nr:xanthine dehydrogenase family protein molybdopterin-binding subunit [Candidatus Limnocylindria bacterium]
MIDFRSDERAKLSGATRYVADLQLDGMLVGGVVRSPHPHARIVRIDTSRALAIPGVRAVLTGADVPQVVFGPTAVKDWNILARERAIMIGDEIVAIAATDRRALAAALAAIEVEYEPLPAIFDPELAMREDAPAIHPGTERNRPLHVKVERGDVDAALAGAHLVVSRRYTTNRIYQGYLEPNAVIARWDDGGLTLFAPSHIPTRARETYAAAFELPLEQVRIVVPPIGGSFGGKYVLKIHLIAAALARAAAAPVKIVQDRTDDMEAAHPRVPIVTEIRIGVDAEGNFVGKDVVVYADAGSRVYWSPNVVQTACTRPDNLYDFGAVRAEGHLVYTNQSPTTCMRGFGNAEALFAVENVIDEIAEQLGIDPAELRRKNVVRPGETTIHGWRISSCELDACISEVQRLSRWERRASLPRWRGMGIALANHVSGFRPIDPRFEGSNAVARIDADGNVEIETGEIDLGQGLPGAYAALAARVLGVETERVVVRSGDTGLMPYGIGTLASRATVIGGGAVVQACEALLALLAPYRDGDAPIARAAGAYGAANGGNRAEASARYTPDTEMPDKRGYGNASPNYPFAAHVAEVEVDPLTGKVRVVGYWAAHDSGTIVNPVGARSQVIGAIAQGIGWVLMEDLLVGGGRVANPSMMDYRLPGSDDVPPVEIAFVETPDPNGPFGAKSLSECAIDPVAAAVSNAIAHAIGVRGCDLPLTPERVWTLLASARSAAVPA